MATKRLLVSVFAPEGWPTSVAPEYGRYQLWDTIQQVRLFFWQQGKATKYSWFCGNGWSFCWIFGQDCDLESKSADAWMICLFSCIRTASMDGTTTTSFASFWRRWPSSWTLLLSFDIIDIIDMMIMVIFFTPKLPLKQSFPKTSSPLLRP